MTTPQDFYNKKKYLNSLLAAGDLQLALSICQDYLQSEQHWFWNFALASIYFELKDLNNSLQYFEIALNQIETGHDKTEDIIVSISEIYLLQKKLVNYHQLLVQYLNQNTLYFRLAQKLYISCSLQVNFLDFREYIRSLETLEIEILNKDIPSLKTKLKNFLHFLIQENEFEIIKNILNSSLPDKLYAGDELIFFKGELYYLMGSYMESKDFFLQINDSQIKAVSYKFLAEICRVGGDKFNSAKYSLAYLKMFPKDFSIVRTLAYNYSFKKKNHHFLKKCLNLFRSNQHDPDLNFAIGKIYDDLTLYDQSFSYLKKANSISKQKLIFNKNFMINEIDHYKKCFDVSFYKQNKNQGYNKVTPIFIVGLPRSGSTIIEEILSRHAAVEGLSEIKNFKSNFKYFFNIYDPTIFQKQVGELDQKKLCRIGEKYHNDLKSKLNNHTIFTDKMLFNFAYLPLLKSSFSNSKIIITNRSYKDIFMSIYKNYFSDPFFNFAYDEKNIVDIITIYHHTIRHWKTMMGDDLLIVEYSNLVNDPVSTFQKIFNFCELEWQSSFLQESKERRIVDTASSSQVRKAIYKDSVNISGNYQKYFPQEFAELDKLFI